MEVINQNNQTKSINMEEIFNGMINQMSDHIISCLSNKYGFDKDEAIREIELIQNNNKTYKKCDDSITEHTIVVENQKKMTIDELSTSNNDNNQKKMTIDELSTSNNDNNQKKMTIDELSTSNNDENKIKVEEPVTVPKKKKGRPKKSEKVETNNSVINNNTTPQANQVEEPKKKRGRPKKEKVKVDAIVPDDYENNNAMPAVVSNLLTAVRNNETTTQDAASNILNFNDNSNSNSNIDDVSIDETENANEIAEQVMEEDDDENEEITVEQITINGTEYCIDSKNRLYDPDTTELIGKYNRDDNVIV